jgi:CDP-4-dehydro-6-deoxyglucose reductase
VRISLSKSGRSFRVAPDQSLLEAALDAGLNLPHSCKRGNCGACRARLLDGVVTYPNGRPLGLSDTEVAEGFVLLCQARAAGDLRIETFEVSTPDQALIKRLPCRIERAESWSHDVMGVFLRLPAAEAFHFEPGQYVDIMLPGGRRRSFSIASPPHDSRLLELHLRRVPGGEFTERLFSDGAVGALLAIEGPLGQFLYRPPRDDSRHSDRSRDPASKSGAPMLLIGGGTGLAPLKSILRHVMETGLQREMVLYWGVRGERDLYAHDELEAMARLGPNLRPASSLRYVPVLSEPSLRWTGHRGWVHEAVLRDIDDLDRYDVYASGPPAMVAAVRQQFSLRGIDPARLSFDSFDYAPDASLRQRTMAATKS